MATASLTDREGRPSVPPKVLVAGHVCLDILPELPPDVQALPRPGELARIGEARLAIGGCVGNVGVALHRLGLETRLVGRIGDDPLGSVLAREIEAAAPGAARLIVSTDPTSYSLIWNRPHADRAIQHFPGANDGFRADDVTDDDLAGALAIHVGYPPVMAALIANDGAELHELLGRARRRGLTTSLDMAVPAADRRDWRPLLERVLPLVDVFLPSFGESRRLLGAGAERAEPAQLAQAFLDLGVRTAGIKLGENGLVVRTAEREIRSTVFETDVAGTTGAGDATVAGFLFALVTGHSLEQAVTAACAVGATSTEAVDGNSAIPAWPEIERRTAVGWRRRVLTPLPGWTHDADSGLWFGPRDERPER